MPALATAIMTLIAIPAISLPPSRLCSKELPSKQQSTAVRASPNGTGESKSTKSSFSYDDDSNESDTDLDLNLDDNSSSDSENDAYQDAKYGSRRQSTPLA